MQVLNVDLKTNEKWSICIAVLILDVDFVDVLSAGIT